MKRKYGKNMDVPGPAIWLAACFFALLFATGILGWAFGGRMGEAVSNTEKRTLAEFPELTLDHLSDIPGELEEWLNDHAPFREQWLDLYAALNFSLFQSIDHASVIVGKDGWFFFKGDGALSEMVGVLPFTEERMAEILDLLLKVRERYAKEPEDFVLFIAPDKEKIYSQYLPQGYENRTGTSRAAELVRYIREHSDIQVVYPAEELRQAAEGDAPLYYRADTHWNCLGGFVGAQALLSCWGYETASLNALDITYETIHSGDITLLGHLPESYVEDVKPSFSGYLDSVSMSVLEDNLETGGIKRTAAQNAPAGQRLVLVRDSFGESMEPSICRYFAEVAEVNRNFLEEAPPESLEGDLFVFEIVERQLENLPGNLCQLLE